MADKTIPALLNDVWAAFRRVGITEDLRIIEHVAAFLLEQGAITLTGELPRKPSDSSEFSESEVRGWLRSASEQAGGAAELFDRHVLFRLPEMLKGGRYPTPRHIVQLMVDLVDTERKHVADFACGSGGLLVNSAGSDLYGVEISPEWARLARANALLHGKQADIREGNALSAVGKDELFDGIVMNPPFGETVRSDYGTRSETALNALALAYLAEDGRAALLAPSGLLFSGSTKERDFRSRAIDDHHLEAVVTLPDDAIQPYSSLRTHLLLVHKVTPEEDTLTWFLRPLFDGYISGRGRDLTRDPQQPNDLMLVKQAVAASRQAAETTTGIPFTIQVLQQDEAFLGVLLRPVAGAILVGARYLPAKTTDDSEEPAILVFEVQQDGVRQFWQRPVEADGGIELVDRPDELTRERLGLKKSEPLPRPLFLNLSSASGQSLTPENAMGQGIIVKSLPTQPAQLMGVAVSRRTLREFDYSLEPDRYLREPEVRAELRLPHDILRDIRNRQAELGERMTQLAGLLVPESPAERRIPSPVMSGQPFGHLDHLQHSIWKTIASMTEPILDEKDQRTAKPFTVQDILGQNVDAGDDAVRLALDIFEAMGLIVPITIKHPKSSEPLRFYRRTQENDIWRRMQQEGDA